MPILWRQNFRSCLDPLTNRSQPGASPCPKPQSMPPVSRATPAICWPLRWSSTYCHGTRKGYAAVDHGEALAGKIGDAGELPADTVSDSAGSKGQSALGRHLTADARDLSSFKTVDEVPRRTDSRRS